MCAVWIVGLQSIIQLREAQLTLAEGEASTALALANAVTRRLLTAQTLDRSEKTSIGVQAGILAGDALVKLGRSADAHARWQGALDSLVNNPAASRLQIQRARFFLLKRLGRREEAAKVSTELDRQGDRHPAYLRET